MTGVTLFGTSPFDAIRHEDEVGEYWTGRELSPLMGYGRWQEFVLVIEKARASLSIVRGEAEAGHHFGIRHTDGGRWGNQQLEDYRLTRFASYLVAMAGDHLKKAVAEARIYFAVKTREAEVRPSLPDISTPRGVLAMAEQFAETARRLVEVEARNAELEPKAAAVDAYMDASGLLLVGTVAKTLGVGERDLWKWLRDRKVVMSDHPSRRNIPYAEYVSAGYFEVKQRAIDTPTGPIARSTPYVTTRGVEFIRRSLERDGLIPRGKRLALVPGGAA
jgi:DNA-damage-inducible protein D